MSDSDDELMKGFAQHQASKYGADTQEGIQQCLECRDVRKVYCEPFIKCEKADCKKYICTTCYPKRGEFCDYCHECKDCSKKLVDCHNCGVYRCAKADNDCGIRKCSNCGMGQCDECDDDYGSECAGCGEEWP